VPAQQRLRRHDQALAAAPGKDSAQRGEEGTIGRPKTRARLLPTKHGKLMAQNEQFDVLGELAATAPHEQPSSVENARYAKERSIGRCSQTSPPPRSRTET
jgi:hypothetical protein